MERLCSAHTHTETKPILMVSFVPPFLFSVLSFLFWYGWNGVRNKTMIVATMMLSIWNSWDRARLASHGRHLHHCRCATFLRWQTICAICFFPLILESGVWEVYKCQSEHFGETLLLRFSHVILLLIFICAVPGGGNLFFDSTWLYAIH